MAGKDTLERMTEDLAKSGLAFQDMFTRVLDHPERNMTDLPGNQQGYVIPYYNIHGKQLQYYRIRCFDRDPKYAQVKNTPNHVYFPPNFRQVFNSAQKSMVILTEGEKKAALACKMGIPCVAFGGADSWINRTILLPKETEMQSYSHNRKLVAAKLPSANVDENMFSTLAIGFQDLIDVCLGAKTMMYIIFDSDSSRGLSYPVQRAAARLGYELRYKGFQMGQIKQLVLPYVEGLDEDEKVGLDDFLIHEEDGGITEFMNLLETCARNPGAFPRHPNVREHINKQLQKPKLDRKQTQNLSLSIITEMDARGRRMFSPSQSQLYYFDGNTRHLMKVKINDGDLQAMHETAFGRLLYRDYGISPAADQRILQWFGAQFAAEDPIEEVEPHRIVAQHIKGEDCVRYQINDGEYIKVTGDLKEPWEIIPNGNGNILFESGLVQEIKKEVLREELRKAWRTPLKMWWREVLSGARLKEQGNNATLMALLYYLSPWLNRWRGTQLPVELLIGEAGSGKSTLAEIRLNILTGDAKLRNAPTDLKDWNASIANAGGLHITDNVHLLDKQLKQRMSDELCRLVTDPNPRIEMRKYYTEADQRVISVNACFGFTAIQQPFAAADIIQRAVILEFDKNISEIKSGKFTFDSYWKEHQLEQFGGRAAWIAHHMRVLHLFFRKVEEKWQPMYRSKHRLVNFEQALMVMADVFGLDGSWIPDHLVAAANSTIGRSDWVLEGLIQWADYQRRSKMPPTKLYSVTDIVAWAENEEEFDKNHVLTNVRSLGRYLQANRNTLITIVGMEEAGKRNNKMVYKVIDRPIEPTYEKGVEPIQIDGPGK